MLVSFEKCHVSHSARKQGTFVFSRFSMLLVPWTRLYFGSLSLPSASAFYYQIRMPFPNSIFKRFKLNKSMTYKRHVTKWSKRSSSLLWAFTFLEQFESTLDNLRIRAFQCVDIIFKIHLHGMVLDSLRLDKIH